jgi:serine O-acetyltransferase
MECNIALSIISLLKVVIEYEKYFNNNEIKKINSTCSDINLLNNITCDAQFGYFKDPSLKCLDQIQFKKGVLGLALYRISNALINVGEENIAFQLHMLSSIKLNMDIDPRCNIDAGIYIDHGTGVVIGETAKIGSRVLIYHGVTLGSMRSNHNKNEKRHPTIGNDAIIGCYSMILGNVHVGHNAKIAAGSIVIKDIPTSTLFINNRERETLL